MKRAALILILAALSLAAAEKLPPLPDVGVAAAKQEILKNCKVPLQVVVLPPMVEPDYRACANDYYKPSEADTAYRLSLIFGREVTVKAIRIAEGFVRSYEINASYADTKLHLVCDETVDHCYSIGGDHKLPEKKDKK